MGERPYLEDLEQSLASVGNREQLAALLRELHVRAGAPSLRTLERWAAARPDEAMLSKSTVSDMLKGSRLPKMAVLTGFVRACGAGPDDVTAWRRAWERVAAAERARALAGRTERDRMREEVLAEVRAQAARIIAEAEAEAAALLEHARAEAARPPVPAGPLTLAMPSLGEHAPEGLVTRWLRRDGDRVEADEPLVEVSVDKVESEVRSPGAGVLRIQVPERETAPPGRPLALIEPL
ncbi:MAG TPA: lipoyl domain-containing protein [Thermomonospora sp.]|nr:lipoyl domain-containing protein [Thermomonospora sp.]